MSFLIDVDKQHANYEKSPPTVRAVVNKALNGVAEVFRDAGLRAGMGDEAEELVAAIYTYYERLQIGRFVGPVAFLTKSREARC